MPIIETIRQRRSVRSYTGLALSREHTESIVNYIKSLKAPFGAKVRIQLIQAVTGDSKPVKLGTYGWIGGAVDYLALIYEEGPLAEESAAYLFEQTLLYCTGLGLGTCWLGGSFNRKDFKGQLDLKANEKLKIVSPVGYISDKKRFVEKYIVGAEKNHRTRKPFESIFFHKNFTTPLSEELAGIYRQPLEMVRLAPSANNLQDWRIVLDEGVLHFYQHLSALGLFVATDMGIALCHFEQVCRELNIAGKFDVLDKFGKVPENKGNKYTISWVET
ncbi:nitroreductase [Bacteroidia bacterium]|nr:nitroreductase [Bacteroidia bacterium]GHV71724.1 nitroreductase [Bacteroidia bacterium]